jgi:hypothetical protein
MRHGARRERAAGRADGTDPVTRGALLLAAAALLAAPAPGTGQPAGGPAPVSWGTVVAVLDMPADAVTEAVTAGVAATGGRAVPNLRPGLLPKVHDRLLTSFGLAVGRVRERAECGGLFASLGAAGTEALRRTFYYPAPPEVVRTRCARGVLAATVPGSVVTWVCPAFGALSTPRGALVLIHEALHLSGLPERPQTPGAMSSAEINDMVHDACRL